MSNNAWGHADGVAPQDYGENEAGPWSDATGDYIYGAGGDGEGHATDIMDAAPWSFEKFTGPVDQSSQPGSQGPLGGSTPGENPI